MWHANQKSKHSILERAFKSRG